MSQTSRSSFNETWLFEMPSGLGNFETYDALEYSIKDYVKSGQSPISLGNNLFKIDGQQVVYYWYELDKTITLGIQFDKKPQGLVVGLVGKNPKLKGRAPFASTLYDSVLADTKGSIRILSDTQLSDEGYSLWKRLLSQGHKVSLYDRDQPGKTFTTFQTPDEMDEYFKHDDTAFKRYQYVLSESTMLGETRSYFNTRRFRELSGLDLTD